MLCSSNLNPKTNTKSKSKPPCLQWKGIMSVYRESFKSSTQHLIITSYITNFFVEFMSTNFGAFETLEAQSVLYFILKVFYQMPYKTIRTANTLKRISLCNSLVDPSCDYEVNLVKLIIGSLCIFIVVLSKLSIINDPVATSRGTSGAE